MDGIHLKAGAGAAPLILPDGFFPSAEGFTCQHDELLVRAVILRNRQAVCILSLDIGAFRPTPHFIRELAAKRTGLPLENIWIVSSGSESVPDLPDSVDAAFNSAWYGNILQAVDTALEQAQAGMTDAVMRIGSGSSEVSSPGGKLTIFHVQDSAQRAVVTLFHFGVRSSVLANAAFPEHQKPVSADLSGYACDYAEKELGGVVIMLPGASQDRVPRVTAAAAPGEDPYSVLELLGVELGCDIVRIVNYNSEPIVNPGIAVYGGKAGVSVLRIANIGIAGLPYETTTAVEARIYEEGRFLDPLTVQLAGTPDAAPLDNGPTQAISLLHHAQDMRHSIDPDIAAQVKTVLRDIPYCDRDESQKLDIWYPNEKQDTPYPVVIMLHGGAFQHGTRYEDTLEPMLRALDRGYVVVSADYRLAPTHKFPAPIFDGKAVIRFLRANAETYQLDPKRFALWGFSSGGWLVSMVALTPGNPAFTDPSMGNAEVPENVQAVIDWCGPCANFLHMDEYIRQIDERFADHETDRSPESQFMGRVITDIPDLCDMATPTRYVSPKAPPFLIIHGKADTTVPYQQSQMFFDALIAAGTHAVLHLEEAKGHHGEYWYHEERIGELCLDFLDKNVK